MPKPLQAALSFGGIPDILGGTSGITFGREIEVQDNVPLDGSNATGRTYSPFLIRVVLPDILGGDSGNTLTTARNPQRSPSSATVRSDNRDNAPYAQSQLQARVDPSGVSAFKRLVSRGGVVTGITNASERALEDAYNQAIFQQQFGPTVQNSTQRPVSQRTNNITPAITNDTTALSLALQIKRLSGIPPLLMLINPSNMKTDYTKVAQFQNRNRYGYHYEAWGEEMPKLSFTFKIGAYTVGLQNVTQRGRVVSGVQRASRNDSASFQQLMNLLSMFQGATYLQDTTTGTRAFPMVGNLAIEYDQMVYVGHMESFNFTEDEQHQHGGLDISIEFVANRIYDLASVPGDVQPMQGPNTPTQRSFNSSSLLAPSGRGRSLSVFRVPSLGGTSAVADPVNAWVDDRAQGSITGQTVGLNEQPQFSVLASRRR